MGPTVCGVRRGVRLDVGYGMCKSHRESEVSYPTLVNTRYRTRIGYETVIADELDA